MPFNNSLSSLSKADFSLVSIESFIKFLACSKSSVVNLGFSITSLIFARAFPNDSVSHPAAQDILLFFADSPFVIPSFAKSESISSCFLYIEPSFKSSDKTR